MSIKKKNIGVTLNLSILFEMYNTLQQNYDTLQQNYDSLQQNYDTLQHKYDTLVVTFENTKKDIICNFIEIQNNDTISNNDIINDVINDIISNNNIINDTTNNNDTTNDIINDTINDIINDIISNNDIISKNINNDIICNLNCHYNTEFNSNELVDFEFIELKTNFEILSCNNNKLSIKCDASMYKTIWNNFTKKMLYS